MYRNQRKIVSQKGSYSKLSDSQALDELIDVVVKDEYSSMKRVEKLMKIRTETPFHNHMFVEMLRDGVPEEYVADIMEDVGKYSDSQLHQLQQASHDWLDGKIDSSVFFYMQNPNIDYSIMHQARIDAMNGIPTSIVSDYLYDCYQISDYDEQKRIRGKAILEAEPTSKMNRAEKRYFESAKERVTREMAEDKENAKIARQQRHDYRMSNLSSFDDISERSQTEKSEYDYGY